ncbi:MAG: 3-oxoacyl-ACP synthase III family protein, partial [Fidelibacterota bacterium]
MRRTRIAGVGHYVPENVVTNADLEKLMDTSDEWIIERTGIRRRHFADEDEGASDLAVRASEMALRDAGLSPGDIDLVIFATLSSDYFFPGAAVQVQHKMGMGQVGAFDVRAACSGFLYGLSIADQFVRSRMNDTILLIGAEVQSAALKIDTEHRDTAILFGDGAGAVVLRPSNDDSGILSTHLHSDGKYAKELWLQAPGSRLKPWLSEDILKQNLHTPSMNGREVFRHAITKFPEVIREALDQNDLTLDDVKLIIP